MDFVFWFCNLAFFSCLVVCFAYRKRKENLMKIRRLTSISIDDGDSLDGDNDRENCGETSDESMDTTATKSVKSSHVKEEKFNMYKDQLMLSEWLTEKPFDFIDNWFLVLCPIGKRCLVIASSGQTKAYSRTGHFISSFPSYLPGGNRRDNCAHRKSAILDCIYSELDKTYYILDVMLWNQSHFYDSETDLRFYWLNCKIREEYSKVSTTDHLNPYKFILLDHYNCDNQSIIKAITSYSLKPKVRINNITITLNSQSRLILISLPIDSSYRLMAFYFSTRKVITFPKYLH